MQVTVDDLNYNWIHDWGNIPSASGFSHHGLIVNKRGEIITAHDTESTIYILNKSGEILSSFELPVYENHCLALSEEGGMEYLWVADIGDGVNNLPQLLKTDMQGKVLKRITIEDFKLEGKQSFMPTSIAIEPGTQNIWIADGYGSSRIFSFTKDMDIRFVIDGSEGSAGKFSCPHWIYFDKRKPVAELYIADRSNNQIQVYNAEGKFLRCISEGVTSPSVFANYKDYMVVGELRGCKLLFLNRNDEIVGSLGDGSIHLETKGWPNRVIEGKNVAPNDVAIGEFNSPHGMDIDQDGNIYISEWLIGDRFTKLELVR